MKAKKISLLLITLASISFLMGFDLDVIQDKLDKGEMLINEKKYSQAEEIFMSLNQEINKGELNPQEQITSNIVTPRIYFRLGEIKYYEENYDTAKLYFNKVVNLPVKSNWDSKAYYYLGIIDYNLKKYNEARGNFSRVVNEYSASEEAPEAQYYIGLSYELEGNIEQANISFKKFLLLFPKHSWAEKAIEKIKE